MDDTAHWLALWRAPGVGPARFQALLAHYGHLSRVFEAPRADLARQGLPDQALDWLGRPDWARVEADLEWLSLPGNFLVRITDCAYPPLLREIPRPPPLLFVHGDPELLSWPQLAIVGTRNPTPAGRETAREFAAHLARGGLAITSGLALGVDAAAHEGALEVQGATLAVLGTGPDRVYPARNRQLAHAIAAAGGTLVSELPPGTQAAPEHFPRRNRLISGLSLGVLVVEAALRSGSLITARLAADQGREVFAIPGSIHNPLARGCHSLIRQGAKLVETAADILEELGQRVAVDPARANGQAATEAVGTARDDRLPELDEDYRRLLACLDDGPAGVDILVERSTLTAEAVSSMLLILELQGFVAAAPGGLYARLKTEGL